MADSTIIREFLAELGFKVDKSSFEKFTKGLKGATTQAVALGEIIADVAEAVARAVLRMAQDMDQLYFTSRRLNAAAENVKALMFALQQVGATGAGAQAALEGLASFMRSNPGAERFINALGVSTRDANGQLRDTERILEDLGVAFRKMPFFQAKQYAALLGIDERTLLALENPQVQKNAEQLRKFAEQLGLGADMGADAANRFFEALRNIEAELGLIIIAIASRLLPYIQGFIDFLSELPGYIEQFKQTQLGQTFVELGGAVVRFVEALSHLIMVIVRQLAPVLQGLDQNTLHVLIDTLHYLTDTLNFFSDLLQGRWSDAWKDYGKATTDALRGIAHGIEAATVLALRFEALTNPALQGMADQVQRQMDALISQYLPEAPGRAPPAGAPNPATPPGGYAPPADQGFGPGTNPSGSAGQTGGVYAPGVPGVAPPGRRRQVAATVEKFLVWSGIRPDIAHGVAAGVYAEGGTPGVRDEFDRQGNFALGIGQWRGDRLARLMQRFGPSPTFMQEMQFLLAELRGGDPGGASVLGAGSASEAFRNYVERFMRPGAGAGGDLFRGRGYLMSGGGATIYNEISQKTEVHVNGVRDADGVGRVVESSARRTNANLLRNLKTQVA